MSLFTLQFSLYKHQFTDISHISFVNITNDLCTLNPIIHHEPQIDVLVESLNFSNAYVEPTYSPNIPSISRPLFPFRASLIEFFQLKFTAGHSYWRGDCVPNVKRRDERRHRALTPDAGLTIAVEKGKMNARDRTIVDQRLCLM